MSTPLVSFVMPVFNRAKVIERALDGIIRERREDYPNLEIVVIDGRSSDGTVEILKSYGSEIDYWISERDAGAADAFNKGVRAARGDIIRYVASDDGIVNGFTDLMVGHLLANQETSVVGALANGYHVGSDGEMRPNDAGRNYRAGTLDFPTTLRWTRGRTFSLIETWFIRRSVFDVVGYLDTRYRVCPDYDFALRVVKQGLVFDVLPHRIVQKCFFDDGSNLVADAARLEREHRRLILRHAGVTPIGLAVWYGYPRPLHLRMFGAVQSGFFRFWLLAVVAAKRLAPRSYALVQRLLRRES